MRTARHGRGGIIRWAALAAACLLIPPPGAAAAGDAGRAQEVPQAAAPDVIFVNARFLTLDDASSLAEAVAVTDGKVAAVGDGEAIRRLAGSRTRTVDLGGRTVLPGFYDNHVHIGTGRDPSIQSWGHIDSVDELLASVERRAREIGPDEWVRARLSTERLPEHVLPRREDLDAVAPDRPVALSRGHVWIVNSRALEEAGVTRDTPDPPGGHIDRDEEGDPNGLIRETPAQRKIEAVIPEWEPDPDTARENLRSSLASLLSHGITSVNVAGVRPDVAGWVQDVYDRWGDRLPRATLQIRIRPGFDEYDDLDEAVATEIGYIEGFRFRTGLGDERFKLGAIKMSIDGGMTGQSAWTREPYRERPDWTGTVRIPEEALYRVARRAHDLGWQLGIHSIGDAAVEAAVRVLDRILTENPRDDHRHYLHHWSVQPSDRTISTVLEREIIVSSQPNFTYSLAPYYSNALEGRRLATNNPQASLLERGVRMSYGSDGLPLGPFIGIYAAVTRRGVDGSVYGPDERVDLETALRLYTQGTAFMTFDEDTRGTIEVGKVADFVGIDEDIRSVAPERIKDIEPVFTIIAGDVVWSAEGTALREERSGSAPAGSDGS